MLSDCVISLCAETITSDTVGNQTVTYSEKEVYASRRPIAQSEFFSAHTAGIQPEYVFIVSALDYNGERVIKYDNTLYNVYRFYENQNELTELYVEKRLGL